MIFHGEVTDDALFGPGATLLDHVRPVDEHGRKAGQVVAARPGWLHFEYRLDGDRREIWVAKTPLMNFVSWDDVARAGAALADGVTVPVGLGLAIQNARVKDVHGDELRVRMPSCGHSTLADLSEWNLLIGAVHRGDMDFTGPRYGWVRRPYSDKDLNVGYHGSLTWCRDEFRGGRVARGYFFASRFHVSPPDQRTDRLQWRPVLERIASPADPVARHWNGDQNAPVQWSPSRQAGFAGTVSNDELFGPGVGIAQMISVEGGRFVGDGRPAWLRFLYDGRTLLVASQPIKQSVSWSAIAQAGAARGDAGRLRLGWKWYTQNAEVSDRHGRRYRVRLIGCGGHTMDVAAEWNALMGGIHRGDGDFVAYPEGIYGWLPQPYDDDGLAVGEGFGRATWCRETIEIGGKTHGVNRGYVTISRFHATEIGYEGSGFGWRPVLELLP
ncbi:MAG: hypothetical protein MUF48_23285 [Pirellulaceae bacterium]|nr:hypothetical protein [Pirellulaceae bacterium]